MNGFLLHRLLALALIVVWVLSGGAAGVALAQASSQSGVAVSIRVDPIAEVNFPHGTHFVIIVPHPECLAHASPADHFHEFSGEHADAHSRDDKSNGGRCVQWSPPILPVRIPFIVTGNARAVVSARPDAFLRLKSRHYLGRSVQPGHGSLGYHAVVHFPAPDAFYHWGFGWNGGDNWSAWTNWAGFGRLPSWSRIAQLPGRDGVGTPALSADLVGRGGTAYGVIYLVADNDWTVSGADADPGDYYGSIEVTVTATQQY